MDRQFGWILILGAALGISLGTYAGCQTESAAPPAVDAGSTSSNLEETADNRRGAIFNDATLKTSADSIAIDQSVEIDEKNSETSPIGPKSNTDVANAAETGLDEKKHATVETPGPDPLLADWAQPKLALILSGEQHGYFEPCGCTENQSGGVSRRADLFRQIRERGWSVTGLDLGGTARRTRRQAQIKFETTLAALRKMDYSALAMGKEELELGIDYLVGQQDADNPMFLGANVVFFDPSLGIPLKSKVVTINGVKVGVTAILGEKLKGVSLVAKNNSDLEILPAEEVLPEVVEDLKKEECDLYVMLSHADLEQTQALVKQFPIFDLVLSAGGPEDPDPKAMHIDKTMIVNIGHKGKHSGVVGFYPDNEKMPLKFELVTLDRARFEDTPEMVALMRDYQGRLLDEQLAATEPAIKHPSEAIFVGAEACGVCHTSAFEKWKTTKHAIGFESLKDARKELPAFKGITRIFDPECLSCHVTGWDPQSYTRYESGFINKEFATTEEELQRFQLLQGQQCESCHGPGSKHISLIEEADSDEATEEAAKLVRVTLEQAKQKTCYECHDLDNSPHFDFDTYWDDVEHYGLD